MSYTLNISVKEYEKGVGNSVSKFFSYKKSV